MHRRQEVWGLKGGIVAPDVTGGVHALRVNAGMALDGAFPPCVHVFLQVQNLKMLPSSQRKMCDVSWQRGQRMHACSAQAKYCDSEL